MEKHGNKKPFEDLSPIRNIVIIHCHFSFLGCNSIQIPPAKRISQPVFLHRTLKFRCCWGCRRAPPCGSCGRWPWWCENPDGFFRAQNYDHQWINVHVGSKAFPFLRNQFSLNYPSFHNHGSKKWVPPIVDTFQIPPFSTSMILGERVWLVEEVVFSLQTLMGWNCFLELPSPALKIAKFSALGFQLSWDAPGPSHSEHHQFCHTSTKKSI